MGVMQQEKGVVLDRPDLTILDTREMEWEPHPSGHANRYRKVLEHDAQGVPAVMVNYFPADFTLPDLPYRHHHSTTHEYSFYLTGEFPSWEYESAEQQHGQVRVTKEGWFMHRWPGSIHGREPGLTTPVGVQMLIWRSGGGTEMGDETFETETVEVPYARDWQPRPLTDVATPGSDGTVIDRPDVRILDTRAMEWEPVAEWAGISGLQRAKRKVLDRDADGAPAVTLVYMPPGATLPDLPHRHYHSTVHEYALFLAGELPHWEYENAEQRKGDLVVFKPGYFMHRRPGSIHGLEAGPTSRVGALFLLWRTGVGTEIGETTFDSETVEVPYG